MQAIQTKYIPPTNHRDGRVKATCASKSITIVWDDSLRETHNAFSTIEANHYLAAYKLAKSLNWLEHKVTLHGGTLKDGSYVWVMVNDSIK